MNVKELLNRLKDMPLDTEVCISEACGGDTRLGDYWLVDLEIRKNDDDFAIKNKVVLRGME